MWLWQMWIMRKPYSKVECSFPECEENRFLIVLSKLDVENNYFENIIPVSVRIFTCLCKALLFTTFLSYCSFVQQLLVPKQRLLRKYFILYLVFCFKWWNTLSCLCWPWIFLPDQSSKDLNSGSHLHILVTMYSWKSEKSPLKNCAFQDFYWLRSEVKRR